MRTDKQAFSDVLNRFNPWWRNQATPGLPPWRRPAYAELRTWMRDPPDQRAVLISGARQVGKTTLLLQMAEELASSVDPSTVFYASFDHPLLRQAGLEEVVEIWQDFHPTSGKAEYFLLDEIQNASDWEIWLKHQADFQKTRRIAATGSALPLHDADRESGVGRWHTVKLPTLSFYEYLRVRDAELSGLPSFGSLAGLFDLGESEIMVTGARCRSLIPHFNEYLLRGGFPRNSLAPSISDAQKMLREDILDKILRSDMARIHDVHNLGDLERVFLYLCLHDGGILNIASICREMELNKPSVYRYIEALESSNMIYKLKRYSRGKSILRDTDKVYLADPAIAGSVLLWGRGLLEDSTRLGTAVESAFFKHVFTRYYREAIRFSYWRDRGQREVDIIAETGTGTIPFEVKYSGTNVTAKQLKGLRYFCEQNDIDRGYVITRNIEDFGLSPGPGNTKTMRIPAPLACYWLSESEHT